MPFLHRLTIDPMPKNLDPCGTIIFKPQSGGNLDPWSLSSEPRCRVVLSLAVCRVVFDNYSTIRQSSLEFKSRFQWANS